MPHQLKNPADTKKHSQKSEETAAADAVQAQIDVSVTQVRHLVSSWLPLLSGDEAASATEIGSLEAETSASQSGRRAKHASTEALRRALMGGAKASRHQSRFQKSSNLDSAATSRKHRLQQSDEESDDDMGRSSLGKVKKGKSKPLASKTELKKATSPEDLKTITVAATQEVSSDAPVPQKKKNKKKVSDKASE